MATTPAALGFSGLLVVVFGASHAAVLGGNSATT